MKGKVLVLYYHNLGYPLRETNKDMLYCFRDFSDKCVYMVNAAFSIPSWIYRMQFDLIIYHDLLLCKRSLPRRFLRFIRKAQKLKELQGYKIAIVQDEFTQTDILNNFLVDFGIDHIFSCAAESEWSRIYPSVDRSKVRFDTILTGYINENKLELIKTLETTINEKHIDIGYRANYSKRYSLGSHGLLKGKVADVVLERASNRDLHLDISTDFKDSILGDEWYRFLLRSKYTLGVESGASILDHDGEIERKVKIYLDSHPDAGYEEVEKKCFEGKDGNLRLFALGPRHFEAVMTKTCQILVEGSYNGIFKPWIHYIPLKKDFSDLDDIIKLVKQDTLRSEVVERAYNDIVLSRKYTYQAFVDFIFEKAPGKSHLWSEVAQDDLKIYKKSLYREKTLWKIIPIRSFVINTVFKMMPVSFFRKIENFMLQKNA